MGKRVKGTQEGYITYKSLFDSGGFSCREIENFPDEPIIV